MMIKTRIFSSNLQQPRERKEVSKALPLDSLEDTIPNKSGTQNHYIEIQYYDFINCAKNGGKMLIKIQKHTQKLPNFQKKIEK